MVQQGVIDKTDTTLTCAYSNLKTLYYNTARRHFVWNWEQKQEMAPHILILSLFSYVDNQK